LRVTQLFFVFLSYAYYWRNLVLGWHRYSKSVLLKLLSLGSRQQHGTTAQGL